MDGIILDIDKKSEEELEKLHLDPNSIVNEVTEEDGSKLRKRDFNIDDIKFTEAEMEYFRKAYSHSIVQDFGDEYHLPKEERNRIRERNAKFLRLKREFPKKIRRIDKFVEAYRLCMDILDDIAKENKLYTERKFKKKVLKGEIKVYGLKFPKYIGPGRKTINWKYIAEYIMDPDKDVNDLVKHDELDGIEYDTTLSLDDKVKMYFKEGEMERYIDDAVKEIQNPEPDEFIYDEDNYTGNLVLPVSDKELKKTLKEIPGLMKIFKEKKKRDERVRRINATSFSLDSTEFDYLEDYEKKYGKKHHDDAPEFKGDIMNDDDVDRYLMECDEWLKDHEFVEYHGRTVTVREREELDIKELMEENSWNLKNCYNNKDKEKRLKKAMKADKKRKKRLKKMMEEIDDRQRRRESGKYSSKDLKKIDDIIKKEKKKKKKKGKKKKDSLEFDDTSKKKKKKGKKGKKGKKDKKKDKLKNKKKKGEKIILDIVNESKSKKYKNWKQYEKAMSVL